MKFVEFYNKNENIKSLGFSKVFYQKEKFWLKPKNFFGKNFAVCKKIRNFAFGKVTIILTKT